VKEDVPLLFQPDRIRYADSPIKKLVYFYGAHIRHIRIRSLNDIPRS